MTLDELKSAQHSTETSRSQSNELAARIEELEASISFAQKALQDVEDVKHQQDIQISEANEAMVKLKQDFETEVYSFEFRTEHNLFLFRGHHFKTSSTKLFPQTKSSLVMLNK